MSVQLSNKKQTRNNQKGQGMSEYIIITALIAVAAIGVFSSFGSVIGNQVAAMSKQMAGQDGSGDVTKAGASATAAAASADLDNGLSLYDDRDSN